MSQRILLIEDDRELRAALKEALSVEGYAVQTSASLADARALLQHAERHSAPELVLLDAGRPEGVGVTFLAGLRRVGGRPGTVIWAR